MKQRNPLLYFLVLLILCSCSKKEVSPQEYVDYVNNVDNGLVKSIELGEYILEAQWRPLEYMVIQQIGIDNITKENFQEACKENEGRQFFMFRIGSKDKKTDALTNGISNPQEYNDRISYLISSINKDLYLIEGKDTVPCMIHHFERSYHLTHYHTVLVTFDKPVNNNEDKILMYNDAILGVGKVNIRFNKKAIQHLPTILL